MNTENVPSWFIELMDSITDYAENIQSGGLSCDYFEQIRSFDDSLLSLLIQ